MRIFLILAALLWLAPCLTPAWAQKTAAKTELNIWPKESPFSPDPKLRCTAQGALARCTFVPATGTDNGQGLNYAIAAKQSGATIVVALSVPFEIPAGKSLKGFEALLQITTNRTATGSIKIGGELGGTAITYVGAAANGKQQLALSSARALMGPAKGTYDVVLKIELGRKLPTDRATLTLNALDIRVLVE